MTNVLDCFIDSPKVEVMTDLDSVSQFKKSSSLCDVAVSMTVQNMLTLDPENMTFTAMFEIDFKYNLKDFIDLFQLQGEEKKAENFEFPYIVCNTVEQEILRSNHFFRLCDGYTDATDVSMYGDPKSVRTSLSNNDDISKVIKCEKYCVVGTYRYHSDGSHQPFDEIFAFFKIATDGRPGTEYTTLKFHNSDSSFVAFRKEIRDYVSVDDPVPLDVDMSHEYKESSGPTYPRVYLFQRFRHRWLEDVLKFYILRKFLHHVNFFIFLCRHQILISHKRFFIFFMTASFLPLLLIFSAQDSGTDSIVETIALSSGLILSDIALLFVNNSPDLTGSEQSLIFNLAYLIFGSIISSVIGGSKLSNMYRLSVFSFVVLSPLFAMLLAVYHNLRARNESRELVYQLKQQNFDRLKDLV